MAQAPSNFGRWRGAVFPFVLGIFLTITAIVLWRAAGMPALAFIALSMGLASLALCVAAIAAASSLPARVKAFFARLLGTPTPAPPIDTAPGVAGVSLANLEEALRMAIVDFGPTSTDAQSLTFALANAKAHAGDLAGAEADLTWCIAWQEARVPLQRAELARCHAMRGGVRQMRGDLAGAEVDLSRSIAFTECTAPLDHRDLSLDYSLRSWIREGRGDPSGAESDLNRAIEHGEAQLPMDEWNLAAHYSSRSRLRRARRDFAGAEADIQACIDRHERRVPPDGEGLAVLYSARGAIRGDQHRLAEARADLDRALAWFKAHPEASAENRESLHAVRARLDNAEPT